MIDTKELREAIQTFGSQAINEGDLNELLDRLELAESKEASYKKAFEISENTIRDLTEKIIPNIRNKLEAVERDITLKERIIDSLGSTLNAVSNERDVLRDRLALESQENGALRDSVDRACEERDELRTELKEVRHGVAVAHDVINTLRTRIEEIEQQEPVVEVQCAAGIPNSFLDFVSTDGYLPKLCNKLYLAPGAKGEEK